MKYPRYKYVFAFFDFTVIFLSFIFAQHLTADILNKKIIVYENEHLMLVTFFIFTLIFIFIFQNNNLYKINIFLTRAVHFTSIIKSIFYGTLILIIFSFIIKFNLIISSRVFVISFFFIALSGITLVRLFFLKPFYLNFTKILNNSNVIIIGGGKTGKLLAGKLLLENYYGIKVAGFLDDSIPKDEDVFKGIVCLGEINELEKIVNKLNIDEIIISPDNIGYDGLMDIIDKCVLLEKTVKLTSELFNVVPEKIVTESYSGIPVVDLSPKVNKNLNYIYKRVFDYTAAVTGIILLSPLFLLISALVKFSSPGKILFKHTRIGKNGKPFMFYKFRSMYAADEKDESRQNQMMKFMKDEKPVIINSTKVISEERVTPVGKFLRKTSLDELPQLFNVIKGDMSLVGPRPCLLYEYEAFDDWHKRRHTVLPGCTGVWQVSGRSSVSFKDSVILDLYYINNMTPWLDLQLIFKTFPVMIFGRGAK